MNIDCTTCELQLAEYAGGGLSPDERRSVTEHLADCPACRAELDCEHELRRVLGGLPVLACPASVTERLGESGSGPRGRHWRLGVGLAAAMLAAILLGPGVASHTRLLKAGIWRDDKTAASATYTPAEIAQARRDVETTLALAVGIVERGRDQAVVDIFARQLPAAVAGSLSRPGAAKDPVRPVTRPETRPETRGGNG